MKMFDIFKTLKPESVWSFKDLLKFFSLLKDLPHHSSLQKASSSLK